MKPRRAPSTLQSADARAAMESWKFAVASAGPNRDSMGSLGSNRRSSVALAKIEAFPVNDRSFQLSAIRSINAYLTFHSFHVTLTLKPLPSAKDITETFRFVLQRYDWESDKLDDDLPILLKNLGLPVKFNKGALKAPGTPHSWPHLLGILYWLVQGVKYKEHLCSDSWEFFPDNELLQYTALCYEHFLRGNDESVAEIDKEYVSKLEQQNTVSMQNLEAMEKAVADLQTKVQEFRSRPSRKEVLERDKELLKADIQKFSVLVKELVSRTKDLEASLDNRAHDLENRLKEIDKIMGENEGLQKRIDEQSVNIRDADKMRRELQAVENETLEMEKAKIGWEEKMWDLQVPTGNTLKELECLVADCNEAMKRLKVGSEFCFKLNSKGLTAGEILGVDYKKSVKPLQLSFLVETKKSSKESLEHMVTLQQQLHNFSAQVDAKRNDNALLLAKKEKAEADQSLVKKQMQEYLSHCATTSKRLHQDVERRQQSAVMQEKEADKYLKAAVLENEEVNKRYDEEVQACGHELLQLEQALLEHKEHNKHVLSGMHSAVNEIAELIV